MINPRIKVSVSYEQPETTKFDELRKQYDIAKQIADETVSYYTPLAEAAEEAKMKAILDQLKNIERYCFQIASLRTSKKAKVSTMITGEMRGHHNLGCIWFSVECTIENDHIPKYYKKWGYNEFSMENLKNHSYVFTDKGFDILKNWDTWKVYQELEDNAIYQMKSLIKQQEERGKEQIERLNNIVK